MGNLWRVPILSNRRATWADAEQLTFEQARIETIDVSPDGERIAFSSDRSGNPTLWLMSLPDGTPQRITSGSTSDWYPSWSPDGKRLAFYSLRTGNRDIWTLSLETGETTQLTTDPAWDGGYTIWAPSQDAVAFNSNRSGNFDVWILGLDGGLPRQLTTDTGYDGVSDWSDNANRVLIASNRDGRYRLWTMPADGSAAPALVSKRSSLEGRWSKDGSRVYLVGMGESWPNLWVIDPSTGSERQLTDFSGRRGAINARALAVTDEYLYFVWEEDLGDIWVMDVVTED